MDYIEQQQLTIPVVQVYLAIEEQLLINVAKKLKRDKSLLTEADIQSWQSRKLAELGSLSQQNIITISKHSGLAIDEISQILHKAGYSTVGQFEDDLQEAVRQGKAIQAPPIATSTALEGVLLSYQRRARDTFNLVNTTLLNQSQQIYLDIINQTVGSLLTGNLTPQEALRQVVRQWADKGVPALIDKAGKRWSTEAYVSMIARTASTQVANDMQMSRFDEYGVDLVEISSHAACRTTHIPFQGNIYSRSGASDRYPPLSDTGYGTIEGIGGINCRHIVYPYIEGVSVKRFHPYDATESKIAYTNSQKQRYLERRIRQAKKERSMMEGMGDDEGVQQANKKIRDRQATMRDFIDETNRTRRYNREAIR